jgi:hypothetical protein
LSRDEAAAELTARLRGGPNSSVNLDDRAYALTHFVKHGPKERTLLIEQAASALLSLISEDPEFELRVTKWQSARWRISIERVEPWDDEVRTAPLMRAEREEDVAKGKPEAHPDDYVCGVFTAAALDLAAACGRCPEFMQQFRRAHG